MRKKFMEESLSLKCKYKVLLLSPKYNNKLIGILSFKALMFGYNLKFGGN